MNLQEYHPLPQPDEIPQREKEDAMGAYLMMFAAAAVALPLPVINLIAAIVYYYLNKNKSRFIHFHALQSVLSQIPTTLLNWGLLIWLLQIYFFEAAEPNSIFTGYLIMVIIANLLYFIFSVIAAVKARNGKFYYFLFFGPYSYEKVFRIRPEKEKQQTVNLPPQ